MTRSFLLKNQTHQFILVALVTSRIPEDSKLSLRKFFVEQTRTNKNIEIWTSLTDAPLSFFHATKMLLVNNFDLIPETITCFFFFYSVRPEVSSLPFWCSLWLIFKVKPYMISYISIIVIIIINSRQQIFLWLSLSLSLSLHSSLLAIILGMSSRQHAVSALNCWT